MTLISFFLNVGTPPNLLCVKDACSMKKHIIEFNQFF